MIILSQKKRTKMRVVVCCSILWIIHCVLVVVTFPVTELFSVMPLLHVDSPFHQYQMRIAAQLWQHELLVGYDPWFAAGYLGGVNYNASAKAPALLLTLFPNATENIVYKVFVFFSAIAAPGFVWLASRIFRMEPIAACSMMLLGCLFWWISAAHWFHSAGMVAFILMSYAALAYIAFVWWVVCNPLNIRYILLLGGLGALGLFIHPLFPLPVIFAFPMLLVFCWQYVQVKTLVRVLIFVPFLSLIFNLPWVITSLHYPGWSQNEISPFQKVVDANIIWLEMLGKIEGNARGAKIYPILWLCSFWIFAPYISIQQRKLLSALLLTSVTLVIFSAVGAIIPAFATLQPNRFSIMAYLLLIIPAASGITAVIALSSSQSWQRYLAQGMAILLALSLVYLGRELLNEVSSKPTPHYAWPAPEIKGEGENTRWLREWITNNTTDEGRILFETAAGRVYDNAHIAGYLSAQTNREFIGGPYVFLHYTDFGDGKLFGRAIQQLTNSEFEDYLVRYNIGWIIVYSANSKAYLEHNLLVEKVANNHLINIYRVKQLTGYFAEGTGLVSERSVGRIKLTNVSGERVILKYHFFDGMKTRPTITILPIKQGDDPTPFIQLVDPVSDIEILYTSY